MNANNIINIHGRLTRDPEMKVGSSGAEYCKFSVAVDKFNGKERDTDFFDCTAFGKTGAAISKFFTKGREIIVVGSMESNTVTKDDGSKVKYWGLKVDTFGFCGSKGDQAAAPAPETAPADQAAGFTAVETDELPF